MIPLIRLKRDVQFNTELTRVVDVLKGIAAARYHQLERAMTRSESHLAAARECLAWMAVAQIPHPFVRPPTGAAGVVMVTSDEGFLGGLNTRVVTRGLEEAKQDGVLAVVGERGAGFLHDARRAATIFPGVQDAKRQALAEQVRDHLVAQILAGRCGTVTVIYPRPLSFSTQEIAVEPLLPCTAWLSAASLDPSTPLGAGSARDRPARTAVLWESRPADVLEYLVGLLLAHRLGQIFAFSRLAELGARTVHLEGSYQELLRQGKLLRGSYFRARHEVIDRSLREIVSAQRKDPDALAV